MADDPHPSVRRILEDHGAGLLDTLADDLSASDLASLLLAVADRRAGDRSAADVLAQYQRDRFVAPGSVSARALRQVASAATRVAGSFEEIQLAPVVPLGLHSVLGGISQNRVVATARNTEVAADPTNGLALEAAVRRRNAPEEVRLSAVQRVTRAQLAGGPQTFAHFTIFGMVTADRDDGDHRFERTAMLSHVTHHCALARELGFGRVRVDLSDLSGRQAQPLEWIRERLVENDVDAGLWPGREAGIGYYPSLCFKVYVTGHDGDEIDVADGGLTRWTQELLQNRKERLMISGVGLDRLAATSPLIER